MTDLLYTLTIEVQKATRVLPDPLPVVKISSRGRLYEDKDPAEQLERACAGLVADLRTKLRKAAGRAA